ncbi:hypothetical protein [Coralloluteibacterium thermophilus]|uniref:DUF4034 domain-containing protein n=1 Tax=Coralloluteibacterium thermophilum TaxID=2707049 RepID=A0ABV9NHZ5_9GAMM
MRLVLLLALLAAVPSTHADDGDAVRVLPAPADCGPLAPRAREACLLQSRGVDAARSRTLARFNAGVDRYLADLEAALSSTGDARDRVLSARIAAWVARRAQSLDAGGFPDAMDFARSHERAAVLASAQRRGADDVLVQWMLATDAITLPYPDLRRDAIARLLELEPDNLAAHLLAVDVLVEGERLAPPPDEAGYDSHHYERLRAYLEAVERHPPPQRLARQSPNGPVEVDVLGAMLAVGLWTDDAAPVYQATSARCAPALDGTTQAPREACLRIADVLIERGDTLLARNLGLAIRQRLEADPERVEALRAQRRQLAWQSLRSAELMPTPEQDPARFRDWLRKVRAPDTDEVELIRATLRELGEPLDPPPYWRPQTQMQRRV